MTEKSLRTIMDNSFYIVINLNDTFYYASADAEEIATHDLERMSPIIDKYGNAAFTAYAALRRGHDPVIPKNATDPKFIAAKKELRELIGESKNYLFTEIRERAEK